MTPDEALQTIARGDILPVWLVVGEERFLKDRVVNAIAKSVLSGSIADFNHDCFNAGETSVDVALSATRTAPMMAKKRIVQIRYLERWDTASTKDGDDSDDNENSKQATDSASGRGASDANPNAVAPLDRIAEYAKSPIESTTLVLTAQKLDGRRKLLALAKKQGFIVDCTQLDSRQLPKWVAKRADEKGHRIEPHVAELIAEIAGPDLSQLDDVIERLSLSVGKAAPIDEHAVRINVTRVRLADTWALVEAASRKDLARVLALFDDVFDHRDRGLPLLGAIAWTLRQLLKLQAALVTGASLDEAARTAGIYPAFRAREYAEKLRAFRPRELERWLTMLQETDLALKSSRRPADAILQELFTRLCRN